MQIEGWRDDSLILRVEAVTCDHCAVIIKKAVESALPGALLDADPSSKLASIRSAADLAAVAVLKSLKTGDRIRFQADRVNGQISVVRIQKGK